VCPCRFETCGETSIGMRAARKADDHHARRAPCSHTVLAILYDEAPGGRCVQPVSHVEKKVRRRLSICDEVGGIDVGPECGCEACQFKLAVELVLLRGRSDRDGAVKTGRKVQRAVYCRELRLETRPDRSLYDRWEVVRQVYAPVFGIVAEGGVIVAIMEADKAGEVGLIVVDKAPAGQVLSLDRNGDDLRINQDAIAIENDGLWSLHLAAPEQLFDVGELQLDIGRAAMVALA
jgi:hypothetical protein